MQSKGKQLQGCWFVSVEALGEPRRLTSNPQVF